ncbi:MAG TPA: PepSY-associated TM helix domain-containing protein, partial [Pseudolysinimonas sp.]|nr:PepSY-associated TM helix domain-containing protein [Pseudolysinimonas sp.]
MSVWSKWTRQPQTVWLRRALFQIHLWTGLALGLYLVMLSLTGSVLVYRNELDAYFRTVRPVYDAKARRLTSDELRSAALRAYPGHTVTRVGDRISRRNPTIEIWVERAGERKERLFNPYTGADLGDSVTKGERSVLWLARLHDELLFDRPGRWWNGVLSGVTCVLTVSGLVIWWPGVTRWRRSLKIKWSS